jgi:RNA polymerase sigma-70 factor (ECF subfamily)
MTLSEPELMLDDRFVIDASLTDPSAFAEVFDRHWPGIFAFCVRRAGHPGEDIAAETFKVAFYRRHRFDATYRDARPWLFGIATNLLRHHFRSDQRAQRAGIRLLALHSREPSVDVGEELESRSLTPELSTALMALTQEERDTLLLLAWAELDYAQIAHALDIPIGTVRSRIHRARSRVRAHLTQENPHA